MNEEGKLKVSFWEYLLYSFFFMKCTICKKNGPYKKSTKTLLKFANAGNGLFIVFTIITFASGYVYNFGIRTLTIIILSIIITFKIVLLIIGYKVAERKNGE